MTPRQTGRLIVDHNITLNLTRQSSVVKRAVLSNVERLSLLEKIAAVESLDENNCG